MLHKFFSKFILIAIITLLNMGVYAQEVEAEKREEKHVNYPEFNKDTLKVKLERKGDRHYRKYSFQKAIHFISEFFREYFPFPRGTRN